MIPDLECTVALDLTHNAVRGGDTVVRSLKDARDLLGDRNREDEEI